jgi:hypothetical protein
MALHEITRDRIVPLTETTFGIAGITERYDLQRLLRDHIEVVAPGTMVIAEEFSDWEDSRRRIDLLALDRDANLVVIELKRNEDGGAMELQAIRYAAMVSTMTFDRLVAAHAAYLTRRGIESDARASMLTFLERSDQDEQALGGTVRILLVSADFSKELATTVLWLNDRDLDITCVRVKPYNLDDRLIVDVQQVIPLLEAAEYQVRFKEKIREERERLSSGRDYTRYDVTVDGMTQTRLPKRQAAYQILRALCERGVTPERIASLVPGKPRLFRSVEGEVDANTFATLASAERPFDPRRWFRAEDELIRTGGRTYAVSSQWGAATGTLLEGVVAALPEHEIGMQESAED